MGDRVLVCGGRDYSNEKMVNVILDTHNDLEGIDLIIQGGATGADTLAKKWAEANDIPFKEYRADWKRYKKAAGPIRNKRMLEESEPDIVFAFGGKTGTNHMVSIAKKAMIPVMRF